MNLILKTTIAGALCAVASHALAMGAPLSNSSDLVLLISNATTGSSYGLDTGISLDTLLPTASLISGASLNKSLPGVAKTIKESSTLKSFLASNPITGDVWTLIGAQGTATTNAATKNPGAAKLAYTSTFCTQTNANCAGFTLGNLQAPLFGLNNDISSQTNGFLEGLLTSTHTTGAVGTSAIFTKYGVFGASDMQTPGKSEQLFAFTGNGNTGALQSYILGSATFSSKGVLTIKGNAVADLEPLTTPLPGAVWLLGSGLLGLIGFSRRRAA